MRINLTLKGKIVAGVIIALIIAIMFVSCDKKKPPTPDKAITSVTLSPIGEHTIPQTVTSYGTTTSPKSVVIAPQTEGTILSVNFKPGQTVKKGQLLFTMRVSDVSAQLQTLKAQTENSKSQYERLKKMSEQDKGLVAAQDLLTAKLQYAQDQAAYQEAARIGNITSPIDGVISDTDFTDGSFTTTGQTLATVVDPNSLQIKYQIPSQYDNKVKTGQLVEFYPNNNKQKFTAKVSYIAPTLNTDDYSLTIRADFAKPQELKPELFGKVVQTINADFKTPAVSQTLVQTDAQGFYVYTVDNKKVSKKYFAPGEITNKGMIQVKSGMDANTKIISSDISSLNPGETVTVK